MAVAAVANTILSPFVALVSPKAMVRMHVDCGLATLTEIFRTGRFDYNFEVKPPNGAVRLKMFEAKLRGKKNC